MHVDPRLLRQAGAARGYLAVTVGCGLAGAGLILLQAGLLAQALAGAAHETGITALSATLALLGVVFAGRAVATGGGEASALRAAAAVKSGLRRRLASHALRLGPRWLGGQQTGEITTLATRGLDGLDPYFARYLPQLVLAATVPLAVLIRVAFADWISALIIAATLPLIPLFAALIGWHTQARTRRQWQLLARLGGHFLDVVAGLPTLKLFGRDGVQATVIRDVTGAHRKATMATLRVAFLSSLALELVAAVATALVAVETGLRLLTGHLGYQTALLILLLTPEAYLPLRNAGAEYHASTEGMAAAARAFEILDTPLADQPARTAVASAASVDADVDLSRADIVFQDVTLSYPGRERPALDAIGLTIQPGEHIVVTGPSGAGKSSLLALLLRFAVPDGGIITAGGAELARLAVDRWLAQIAWVPQHPHLFAMTVADNIALGQPGGQRQDIVTAARLAGADEFIRRLPDGYDTALAEGARVLSAGQRQKIALARAFLRRVPVVLLDEPAAHLDPASAARVVVAIDNQLADRTVVLVTHQPPRASRGWRILTLEHGRLTASADPGEAGEAPVRRDRLAVAP